MTCFNFDVITLFPKAFESINNLGVITRALNKNLINVNLHDLREYGEGNYRQVDDKPYGGGSGVGFKPSRRLPRKGYHVPGDYYLLRILLNPGS
jgi:tRNA (guanine-N1)-methyltransferase